MQSISNYTEVSLMNVKRGFTFVEMLVVIAIIAILALILFPVFASAKPAQERDRRSAASLSNAKQIGAAAFMYTDDNDDRSPMHQSWQSDSPVVIGGCGMTTWAHSCMEYLPNPGILNDPLASPEFPPNGGWTPALWFAIFTQYGMNHLVWSGMRSTPGGVTCYHPWRPNPIKLTEVARPAAVPLFVSKSTSPEQGGNGTLWWLGPGTLISSNIVDPPVCDGTIDACFGSWGGGSNWDTILQIGGQVAGRYTGDSSRRRSGNHVVVFGDGHGEALTAEQLAVGTNWQDNTRWPSSSTVITDLTVYRWTSR
jgi:prepilin-type N-terminal cleavage/methylation domain-containing protein